MKKVTVIIALFCSSCVYNTRTDAPPQGTQSDYGFDVDMDGYTIWSGDRVVSRIQHGMIPALDSIIDKDNQ